MRSYTTPLRRRDKVSRGCRRGGGQVRSTDTTLHQFHRQPALSFICAIRATPFVTFSLVAHSLSLFLVRILASSLSLHGLTIVSRDRTTLRRNASNEITTTTTTTTTTSSLEICFFVWPRSFFFPLSVVIAIVFVVVNLVLSRVLAPRGA